MIIMKSGHKFILFKGKVIKLYTVQIKILKNENSNIFISLWEKYSKMGTCKDLKFEGNVFGYILNQWCSQK